MTYRWRKAQFAIGMPAGPITVSGWTCGGIGIATARYGHSGDRQNEGFFTLTHLKTGHGLATLHGSLGDAKKTGLRVAKAADWSFSDLPRAGTKRLRDLQFAVEAALLPDPTAMLGTGTGERSKKVARQVAQVTA